MNVKKRVVIISVALILLVGSAACYAPRLLAYADKPFKSDAIILFLGPSQTARGKEANLLLNEGYARFLLVPGLHQVIAPAGIPQELAGAMQHTALSGARGYPSYYEKTHLEVLFAKRMMDVMELKSAIMVSSPYHMKRIKTICEKVFGEQAYYISYVPTRYERGMTDLLNIDKADIRPMMLEFAKIFWFYLYSSFSDWV